MKKQKIGAFLDTLLLIWKKEEIWKGFIPEHIVFLNTHQWCEFQWENLGLIAASVPESVICLISALVFYD